MSLAGRSRNRVLYGYESGPTPGCWLRAGAVRALLVGADLRYVSVGCHEVARRLYVAVRDECWGTVPPHVERCAIEHTAAGIRIVVRAEHRQDEISFGWTGSIEMLSSGEISYEIEGEADRAFPFANIGICVHHPSEQLVRTRYQRLLEGGWDEGELPDQIVPQRFNEEGPQSILEPATLFRLEPTAESPVTFEFTGCAFELEDHRNWSDDGFKSYSTRPRKPFPRWATPGFHVRQGVKVTRTPTRSSHRSPSSGTTPPELTLGPKLGAQLPPIGLCWTRPPADNEERMRLTALGLAHLRLEYGGAEDTASLQTAARLVRNLDAQLELVWLLPCDSVASAADWLAPLDRIGDQIGRIVIASCDEDVPPREVRTPLISAIRKRLPDVQIAIGSRRHFCELNRHLGAFEDAPAIAVPVDAQVHASDELSLVETLRGQRAIVCDVRQRTGDKPVHMTPVQLAHLGANDPRLRSLFGAAWLLGSVKALAESGAASITYHGALGSAGVIEHRHVTPVYHVIADLTEATGADLCGCASSRPEEVLGLAVEHTSGTQVWIANVSGDRKRITLHGLNGRPIAVRQLSESTVDLAVDDPESFRCTELVHRRHGDANVELELDACAVMRVDVQRASGDNQNGTPELHYAREDDGLTAVELELNDAVEAGVQESVDL